MGKTKAVETGKDATNYTDYQAQIADQLARDWYGRQAQVQRENTAAAQRQTHQTAALAARQNAEATQRANTQKATSTALAAANGAASDRLGGTAPTPTPTLAPMTAPAGLLAPRVAQPFSVAGMPRRPKPLRAQLFT